MKSNKGVTLTSLIIYIISLITVTAMMGTVIGYFNKNSTQIMVNNSAEEQYLRFLTYIVRDLNKKELSTCEVKKETDPEIILTFTSGDSHEYVFKDGKIYYKVADEKNIILCKNVTTNSEAFKYEGNQLKINIRMNNRIFETNFKVEPSTGN